MQAMLIVIAVLAAEPGPWIEVKNAEQAAKVARAVENLRVVMPDHKDQATLAAVLKHAPHLKRLDLSHPDNGVPACLGLLTKFSKLEDLRFTGDANLDDDAFAILGKLDGLKALRMSLP